MEGRREREQGRSGEATEKTDEGSNEETAQTYACMHTHSHTLTHMCTSTYSIQHSHTETEVKLRLLNISKCTHINTLANRHTWN